MTLVVSLSLNSTSQQLQLQELHEPTGRTITHILLMRNTIKSTILNAILISLYSYHFSDILGQKFIVQYGNTCTKYLHRLSNCNVLSRWLYIGQVLTLHAYGLKMRTKPISSLLDQTNLVHSLWFVNSYTVYIIYI